MTKVETYSVSESLRASPLLRVFLEQPSYWELFPDFVFSIRDTAVVKLASLLSWLP